MEHELWMCVAGVDEDESVVADRAARVRPRRSSRHTIYTRL